ncbi:MAG: bacillithiol biosynthesis BshC, partial [Planctomycetota bacterium]
MSQLVFRIRNYSYQTLPQYGSEHPLAMLSPDRAPALGFPLFTSSRALHTSASPFMHFNDYGPLIDAYNPKLPPIPGDARFVMAGQQPGLLTGPLYTFLKALSAVLLAQRLSLETHSPVLPLFWIASEDHDVLEVNRVTVNNAR